MSQKTFSEMSALRLKMHAQEDELFDDKLRDSLSHVCICLVVSFRKMKILTISTFGFHVFKEF